ncbi:uncharacterized protein B0T15DRAFT_68508 [Chaetomium strumarium]|uniref:HMG box domain-containing protein n=1 Tax=Chaetomium strumarium TaxID=1170767 RepID=A0AAJ0H3X5_9PEZI|nr:hypothetical protein B0T15DRAFT_68508 [Chaetomium strumarium]
MLSAIRRATAGQVRLGGELAIRSASRIAVRFAAPQLMPVVPSGIRVAAVFARGYAGRGRPKGSTTKTSTSAEAKKKPASKTGRAKKTGTAKKTAAAKKAPTKAKKPQKKPAEKPARRPKRELTEEQKTKLEIRDLKKKALVREQPKGLPDKPWSVFTAQRLRAAGRMEGLEVMMPQISVDFKALPSDEVEKLNAIAQQNKVANQVKFQNWIDSHTPQEIRAANLARLQLRRKHGITKYRSIPDARYPKQNLTPFVAFVKSRFPSMADDPSHAKDKLMKIAVEWKGLSAEERKPFHEIAATDTARRQKELDAYREQGSQ